MLKVWLILLGALLSNVSVACSLSPGTDWKSYGLAVSSIIWGVTVLVWFLWVRSLYFFNELRFRIQVLLVLFAIPILYPPYRYLEPELGASCVVNTVKYSALIFIGQLICFVVFILEKLKDRR